MTRRMRGLSILTDQEEKFGVNILECTQRNSWPLVRLSIKSMNVSPLTELTDMWWIALALFLVCIIEV